MVGMTPILVTGAHRSGTTWVGRMLAGAPGIYYIHEPFSVSDPPGAGICAARFSRWFTYVTPATETPYYNAIRNSISLRYDWAAALRSVASPGDARRLLSEGRRFGRERRRGSVPLVKDPNALFSAEWLAGRFDMRIVVMVRHPAAFVSSIKALNWSHPFSDFLTQPLLMQGFLQPFADEIRFYAARQRPVLDQAILLWRLIYHTVDELRSRHGDWLFLRHEDLSRDPVPAFRGLFARLGLSFTREAEALIAAYSGPHNPVQPLQRIGAESALKRDSASGVRNWARHLGPGEIARIRSGVEPLASRFYGEEDW